MRGGTHLCVKDVIRKKKYADKHIAENMRGLVHLRCMRLDECNLGGVFWPYELQVYVNDREVHDPKVPGRSAVAQSESGHTRREPHHLDLTPHLTGGPNKVRVKALFAGEDMNKSWSTK